MMNTLHPISRRTALGLMAAVSVPPTAAVAVAAAKPAPEAFDLQHWLDTADTNAIVNYHAARLAEVMNNRDPARSYRVHVEYKSGFVLVMGDPRKENVVTQEAGL
jgi:hypothetical protein